VGDIVDKRQAARSMCCSSFLLALNSSQKKGCVNNIDITIGTRSPSCLAGKQKRESRDKRNHRDKDKTWIVEK
jgi:hypothetical protein